MEIKSLKEICSLITKGTTPTSLGMKLNEGNINFIKVECLSEDGKIISSKMQKINETTHNKLNRSKLQEGDILYSIAGSIGRMTVVDSSILPANTNQAVAILRPIKELIHTQYLFYFLKDTKSQKSAMRRIVQSVQTNLSLGELSSLEIAIPSLPVQIAIGNFMNNLDTKIAVNNEISKTLEEIAQTIFKSWFIDFDPVKAKMAGEKPKGMDAATAALFPDSMEESELGLIPKGWSWISVGEIANVIDCLHSKKPELIEEGFPYLQLDTISDSGVLRFENAGLISKEDYDKWTSRIEVQGGDCLITNVGRVGAVSQVPDHFKAAIGRNITALRPKDSKLHRSFLIVALLSDFMKKEVKRNTDSGTILEALNVKNIPKLIIPGPSNSVLQELAKLCDPIQMQLHELHRMNVNLSRIRDSLLPRLISGELQIPEEMLAS